MHKFYTNFVGIQGEFSRNIAHKSAKSCAENEKMQLKWIFIAKCLRIPNICSTFAAQRKGRQKTEKNNVPFYPPHTKGLRQ
jgi:hypothetical protein